MIQVNELRIGNLFIAYDDKVFKWDMPLFGLLNQGVELDEIIKSPILITVALLDQFGFSEGFDWESGHYTNNLDSSLVITYNEDTTDFSISKYLKSGFTGSRLVIKNKIKYIHQLQNIYFSLSGKELTLSVT